MELPQTKFPPGRADIEECCGHETIVTMGLVDIRMFSDPPRTTARRIQILHWQCWVTEDHNGDIWEGYHEEGVSHENVFDTNIDDEELGDENRYRG